MEIGSMSTLGIPSWGYSRGWGYGPSGIIGIILIVVIILLLMGRI
jgi:Na+/proline symporter